MDAEKIALIKNLTNFRDDMVISRALQANKGDAERVINEYFEAVDPAQFRSKYSPGWDENAFNSSREGDVAAGIGTPCEYDPTWEMLSQLLTQYSAAFTLDPPDDNQVVLYGSDPGFNYGPSRPPSRAHSRSPLSSMAEMATGSYGVKTAQEQEEEDIRRAVTESLRSSQPTSGPLQAPQQESGITGASLPSPSKPEFGPANRTRSDGYEWDMVRDHKKQKLSDPDPISRKRTEGVPVFLRCRAEEKWKHHRVGGLLMVLHSIPAARNALLRIGDEPAYGYGNDPGWWRGKPILPPETKILHDRWLAEGNPESGYLPPWTDELHRLMAFLDLTERSYGTADILSLCRPDGVGDSGNPEVDFFESYTTELTIANGHDTSGVIGDRTLITTARVGSIGQGEPAMIHNLAHLDWTLGREALAGTESLYDIWDLMFFPDTEDLPSRAAAITDPAEVIVFRFADDEGFEQPIQVPETFYIDRYLQDNRDKVWQSLLDSQTISAAFKKSAAKERSLTQRTLPNSQKTVDCRTLFKKSIEKCQQKIARIKNRAAWAEHETKPFNAEEVYLAENHGEPALDKEESEMIRYYEGKIRKLEESLADIEKTLNDVILPERDNLRKLSLEARKLFKDPAPELGWDPKFKYTLRGVVSESNKIFLRKREQVLMQMEDSSPPAEQWVKMWTMSDSDNAALYKTVSFDEVLSEALGRGKAPVLILASEKAMAEELEPLSSALKTFVKHDNRLFMQELAQSRRRSIDSMATNNASTGDLEDYMDEGYYDDLEDKQGHAAHLAASLNVRNPKVTSLDNQTAPMAMSLEGVIAAEPLVDVAGSTLQTPEQKVAGHSTSDDPVDLLTPGAPEQDHLEMLSKPPPGYSVGNTSLPTCGGVILEGHEDSRDRATMSTQETKQQQPEMQERASTRLITRPDDTASLGSAPMDLSSDKKV
ncbi:hypothetical protein V8F20_000567 [Naviculisporaceae sp. PSN 640]